MQAQPQPGEDLGSRQHRVQPLVAPVLVWAALVAKGARAETEVEVQSRRTCNEQAFVLRAFQNVDV